MGCGEAADHHWDVEKEQSSQKLECNIDVGVTKFLPKSLEFFVLRLQTEHVCTIPHPVSPMDVFSIKLRAKIPKHRDHAQPPMPRESQPANNRDESGIPVAEVAEKCRRSPQHPKGQCNRKPDNVVVKTNDSSNDRTKKADGSMTHFLAKCGAARTEASSFISKLAFPKW